MNVDNIVKYNKDLVLYEVADNELSLFEDKSQKKNIQDIKKGDSVMISDILIYSLKGAFFEECQATFMKKNPGYEKKKNWVKSNQSKLQEISKESLDVFVEYFNLLDEKEQKRVLLEIWRKRSSDEDFDGDGLWRDIIGIYAFKDSFLERISSFKNGLKTVYFGNKDLIEKKYNKQVYGWLSEKLGGRLENFLGRTDVDYIFDRVDQFLKISNKTVEAPIDFYKKVIQALYIENSPNYEVFMEKMDNYRFNNLVNAISKNLYVGHYENIEKFIKFMDDLSEEKKQILADIVTKHIVNESLPEKSVLLERVVKINGVYQRIQKNLFNQKFFKEEEKDGEFIYHCDVYYLLKMKEFYSRDQMLEKEGVAVENVFNSASSVRDKEIECRRVIKEMKENNPESDMENLEAQLKYLRDSQLSNYMKTFSFNILSEWLKEENIDSVKFSLGTEFKGKKYLGLKIEAPLEYKELIKNITLSLLELSNKKEANTKVRPLFDAALMRKNIDDSNVQKHKVRKF